MGKIPFEKRAILVKSATGEEVGCGHVIASILGDLVTLVILAAGFVWSFWVALRNENMSATIAFIIGLVVVMVRWATVLKKCSFNDQRYQEHKARWFNRWSGWIWGVGSAMLVCFVLTPSWWGNRVWIVEKQPVGSFSFALPWQKIQWIETEPYVYLQDVSATTTDGIQVTATIQAQFLGPYKKDVIQELARATLNSEVMVPVLPEIAKEWFRSALLNVDHSALKNVNEISFSPVLAPNNLLERYELKCGPDGLKVTQIHFQGEEAHE